MENSSLAELTVRYQHHGRRGCGPLKKRMETTGLSESERATYDRAYSPKPTPFMMMKMVMMNKSQDSLIYGY